MSIVALWILVLFETVLLLLLLRALGKLRQKGLLTSTNSRRSSEEWGLEVGEQAPLFVATDYDGNQVRLEDFKGRRILAFISLGCSSCAGTVEALNIFLRDEPDVVVLVIGSSERDLNRAYAIEHNAEMPILTPAPGFDKELYRVLGVPFAFVIDEAGKIRAKAIVHDDEQLRLLLIKAFGPVVESR